ncbi:MAG: TrkA family potassium uptake protein [Acidobacteriota bacterium]
MFQQGPAKASVSDCWRRWQRRLKRRLIAEGRHLRILLREFRYSLWILLLTLISSTVLLHYYYPNPQRQFTWGEAFFHTLHSIAASPTTDYPAQSRLAYLFLALPVIGLLLLADTIARLGSLLFQQRSQHKEWQILLASTYSKHIIVCGLGHVGYRVVQNLLRNHMECVVIEAQENVFVSEVRSLGVPVIIADARRQEVLEQANIAQAHAIIVATNDDLANLEVALDARSLRPDIRVVMRMFDEKLARKIAKGFNIQSVFSTSAIAAPVFAAAVTEHNVLSSFIFNDVQLHTIEFTINEGALLIGWTLDRLRSSLELTIALYQDATTVDWNPNPDFLLKPGVKLLIITTSESLRELERLNNAQAATSRT